jgi:ankyrin repeat protein
LYYAVRAGKLETAEFLIKHCGANVNHEDKKQQTPLHIAKNNNKQHLMNLLFTYGARPLEDLRKQADYLETQKMRAVGVQKDEENELQKLKDTNIKVKK